MTPSIFASSEQDRAELADPLLQVVVLVLRPPCARARSGARRRISRIAFAWSSLRPNSLIRPCARRLGALRGADQRDHRVDVVERDQVALEDVRAALGVAQLELQPAGDDLALEVEVVRISSSSESVRGTPSTSATAL